MPRNSIYIVSGNGRVARIKEMTADLNCVLLSQSELSYEDLSRITPQTDIVVIDENTINNRNQSIFNALISNKEITVCGQKFARPEIIISCVGQRRVPFREHFQYIQT